MYCLGLIGNGISKSRMDRLQVYLGELSGVSVEYVKIDAADIDSFDPVSTVQQCLIQGFHGVNITHPYKERVWKLASPALESRYQPIGSYNTIQFSKGKMLGANTDYTGFIRGYHQKMGDSSPGSVLIAGAGGVGKAIAYALADLGATTIRIFDHNNLQSEDLAKTLLNRGTQSVVIDKEDFIEAMRISDGLINCTPLGMHCCPGSAFSTEGFTDQRWVFDAVYTPLETEFLASCRDLSMVKVTGFDLWVYQGLDAFKIFTGIDIEPSEALFRDAICWID